MKAPCNGCTFRKIACHVTCSAYRVYKRRKEEEMLSDVKVQTNLMEFAE